MTTTEFLRLLANVSDHFRWTLVPDQDPANGDRRSRPRFHVMAVIRNRPSYQLDPIRAAAYARTGQITDTWVESAALLGIELKEAAALVAAASDRTWTGPPGGRQPITYLMGIRSSLLDAIGLERDPRPAGSLVRPTST
jgi:hypothetical protein